MLMVKTTSTYLEKVLLFLLLNDYLDLYFAIIKKADNSRYRNRNDKRLVISGPIVFFSNFKLTTFSGKHLEDNIQAHIDF